MDEYEKFNKSPWSKKERFYSNLNMEDITDADYMHAKKVCKDFKIKKMDEHHDLYLKKDMLSFIIVIFSIVEKVNRVKRQYLTLLYVNICWQLLCWYFIWWMLIIWAAVEYIKKGPLKTRITTYHLVRLSLYYCWSVLFVFKMITTFSQCFQKF